MTNTAHAPQTALALLLEELGLEITACDLRRVGRKLAQISGRSTPYTYQHLHQIASGTLDPGRKLARAIDAALAEVDGADPLLVNAHEETIMVPHGWRGRYAYLPIEPKICEKEGCMNQFIPNVPARRYCYTCSPMTRKD